VRCQSEKRVPCSCSVIDSKLTDFMIKEHKARVLDLSVVFKGHKGQRALNQEKPFSFRWSNVSMRSNIAGGLQRIQHPLQCVAVSIMKCMNLTATFIVPRV